MTNGLHTLRAACVEAMRIEGYEGYGLLLDKIEGRAYAAICIKEDSLIMARILNRNADALEVYLHRYEATER